MRVVFLVFSATKGLDAVLLGLSLLLLAGVGGALAVGKRLPGPARAFAPEDGSKMETDASSVIKPLDETPRDADASPLKLATATLALGCFWSPDADFGSLPGVYRTRVGYSGGSKANPSYYDLGDHTETIQVDFDPQQISFGELLDAFFAHHNAAKAAYSVQYRSAIFYHDEDQRSTAEAALQAEAVRRGVRNLATALEPFREFHRAEDYHQKYYLTHDKLLMGELSRLLPSQRAFEDSTLVMRLNALAGHYKLPPQIELPLDALSTEAQARVQELQAYSGGPAIKCTQ